MKIIFRIGLLLIVTTACNRKENKILIDGCNVVPAINTAYSKASRLESLLKEGTTKGLPGTVLGVLSAEGWWASASGLASIEDRFPMQVCQLQYLQSATKIYVAAATLKLYEERRLELNAPVSNYLDETTLKAIESPDRITIRMLLNHTSGIPDYTQQSEYITQLLQHPERTYTRVELLAFLRGKKPLAQPGDSYQYSNTNYLLLSLILDVVTGDHSRYIATEILQPSGLDYTYYHQENYLNRPSLVNSYWDRFSNGSLENVTKQQKTIVGYSYGDDGAIATPFDAVVFLKNLLEGKILKPETVQLMQNWVSDTAGQPVYGLGLSYERAEGQVGYGHGGSGIGSGCALFYLPAKAVYFFLAVNTGTATDGPFTDKAEELKNAIVKELGN